MLIGIDASRAFLKNRTGIEEYSYRVIEHLREELSKKIDVVLYVKKSCISNFTSRNKSPETQNENLKEWKKKDRVGDLKFPENWKIKEIGWKRFWTQGGLSWEMFRRPVDVLLIPAHTVPWVHSRKTVVVVHGLEYEFCPKAYSLWERWFMRITIRLSCRWAWRVVAVSENTKRDLVRLYGVKEEKIRVIYEGVSGSEYPVSGILHAGKEKENTRRNIPNTKYLLFIGRIEERKNVVRIIEAFEILKERYAIPHKLVLVGKPGYGYGRVKSQESKAKSRGDIIELGYVSEGIKRELLRHADVFVFPSLYEGFGLPILEAQSAGVPVVTSDISSMPEVVRFDQQLTTNNQQQERGQESGEECSAVLVDPCDVESIVRGVHTLFSDENVRKQLVSRGYENIKRFSWKKCAKKIAHILIS